MSILSARTNKPIQNEPLQLGNELMTATVINTPSILPGAPFQKIRNLFNKPKTNGQLISIMAILMFLLVLSTVLLFF
jgi:hypothetical protein